MVNQSAQIDKILSALSHDPWASGWAMSEAYRELFGLLGPNGIRELLSHPHDGIALRAAWEEVTLTVPEKLPPRAMTPDRGKLAWFLGFLEGRAQLQAPTWWAEGLLDSHANARDNIYPGHLGRPSYANTALDEVRAPPDHALQWQDGRVILRIGGQSAAIPDDLLIRLRSGGNVSALIAPSRSYLAIHSNVAFPYPLACVERASATVVWQSEVFATCWGSAEGRHRTLVAVTEQQDRIVVFGSSHTGFHVEAFRPDDGASIFRFSSAC